MLAQKKSKLNSYIKIFRFLPFVETVFLAGSLALGRAKSDSDFDVIVGTKPGRIFTARFFCLLVFGLMGLRRRGGKKKDKVCFNHFVTGKNYFIEPYNDYLTRLYRRLLPLYGDEEPVKQFAIQNRLDYEISDKALWSEARDSGFKIWLQKILRSVLGDFIERILRKIQVWHIRKVIRDSRILEGGVKYNEDEIGNFGFYLDRERN